MTPVEEEKKGKRKQIFYGNLVTCWAKYNVPVRKADSAKPDSGLSPGQA